MTARLIFAALSALFGLIAFCAVGIADEKPAAEEPPASTTQVDTKPPAQQPAQDEVEASDNDKVVCKKEPPPIGSRMGGKKVCRTVAEWRRIQATAKQVTDEIKGRNVPEPSS